MRGESEVVVKSLELVYSGCQMEARLSWATKHLFAQIWNVWAFEESPKGRKKGPKESHQTVLKALRGIEGCAPSKVKDVD